MQITATHTSLNALLHLDLRAAAYGRNIKPEGLPTTSIHRAKTSQNSKPGNGESHYLRDFLLPLSQLASTLSAAFSFPTLPRRIHPLKSRYTLSLGTIHHLRSTP
ncbi:hypothetical protein BD311DRAFT_652611 [Dichomitus squalens]|uniref:Uncharacterized protein n=1 Tax=Dichomitus squalens TaxID=114155 RepID=A0A4Q9N2T4_9APHY|nr:hypothetical protein BD311DRAFT_652611 [Dichomitus squalens]